MVFSFCIYLGLLALFWTYARAGLWLADRAGRGALVRESTGGRLVAVEGLRGVLGDTTDRVFV